MFLQQGGTISVSIHRFAYLLRSRVLQFWPSRL
jgi:hypothetical protein